MPAPWEILQGLTEIANHGRPIAVGWHVLLAAELGAVCLGWRPSRRALALQCALLLVSVSALAWAFDNPFNGTLFALLALTIAALAIRFPTTAPTAPVLWQRIGGGMLLAFGAVYPHFLIAASPYEYLYAAPLGLVPCPTLSAIIGLALLSASFGSRAAGMVLSAAGLFYGLFGALRLGVWLDLALLAGASALLFDALRWRAAAHPH